MHYTNLTKILSYALGFLLILSSFIPNALAGVDIKAGPHDDGEGNFLRIAQDMRAILHQDVCLSDDCRFITEQISLNQSDFISQDAKAFKADNVKMCESRSCKVAIGKPNNGMSKIQYFEEKLADITRQVIFPNAKAWLYQNPSLAADHLLDSDAILREGAAQKQRLDELARKEQLALKAASMLDNIASDYNAKLAASTQASEQQFANDVDAITTAAMNVHSNGAPAGEDSRCCSKYCSIQ